MRTWRKSSYSGSTGSACVEVAWRKSSRSGSTGGECVEVALGVEVVGVRDSKNAGPTITVAPAAWRAFLASARH